MLSLPGYFIDNDLRLDRSDTFGGIGGGLLVYAREGMIIRSVKRTSPFNQSLSFQALAKNKNQSLNLTLVYRSPNSSQANDKDLFELIRDHEKNHLIVGDFNFPKINWNNWSSDRKAEGLLDVMEDKFMHQLVDFPTHQ